MCGEPVFVAGEHLVFNPCDQRLGFIRSDVLSKLRFKLLKMSHNGDVIWLIKSTLGVVTGGEHFFAAVPALIPMWGGDEGEKCK